MIALLLGNWRLVLAAIAIASLGAAIGVSRWQLSSCRYEASEYRRAYDLLAQSTQRQSESIREAEQMAAAAAQRGAIARAEAAQARDMATRSANALERVLSGPRPSAECPQAAAVEAVRADLGR